MIWLFLSVVLILVVYLAVQFPAFRKAIWVGLALLLIAIVAGGGMVYYQHKEDERRTELSRRLIRLDEIDFTDLRLRNIGSSWRVTGNVSNRSAHELSGFTLKIRVHDCPIAGRCTTIGENDATAYLLSVPPNQTRAFDEGVYLRDMPEPTKLEWSYSVQEVRAKVK
jgi:hypothetical protein